MNPTDSIKCPKCEALNPDSSKVCSQCGAVLARQDYRASVASGLRFLESEKLSFLESNQIVSKFNPQHVEQFAASIPPQTDSIADLANSAEYGRTLRELPQQRLLQFSETDMGVTQPDAFSGAITETAALTADALSHMKQGNAENHSTLDFAAIRARSSSASNPKAWRDRSEHISPNTEVQEETPERKQAQVLIPKTKDFVERPPVDPSLSAVDKLRQQGLFETLSEEALQQNTKDLMDPSQNDMETSKSQEQPSSDAPTPPSTTDDQDPSKVPEDAANTDNATQSVEHLSDEPDHPDHEDAVVQHLEKTLTAAPTVMLDDPEDSQKMTAVWAILVLFLLGGIGYICYATGMLAGIHPKLNPYQTSDTKPSPAIELIYDNNLPTTTRPQTDLDKVAEGIHLASIDFHAAADIDHWFDRWLQEKNADDLSPESRLENYALATSLYPSNLEYHIHYAESLLEAGQIDNARKYIRSLPSAFSADPEMKTIYNKTWLDDKTFLPNVLTINDKNCDEIAPLGGGSTLTFKLIHNGEILGAFKPHQTRRQSNYLSEIASWRLCELLQCDFKIPYNRPVKIEKSTFERLYNNSKSSKKEFYRKELVDIIWTKDNSSGKYYVYGTLKDWVPDFTRFPIEFLAMWQGWVVQENYVESFPELKNALFPMTKRENTRHLYGTVLNQSHEVTTEQLASQISQVLVFDYLIGNWDRFSGVPEWWGVNCQYKDDHIVSIDNGASFPAYCNDRVTQRFMYIERFSRHFIDALRSLNKEATFRMLFPDQTSYERVNFEQFWKQRSAVLSRVESLSEKYGVDRVLSFE